MEGIHDIQQSLFILDNNIMAAHENEFTRAALSTGGRAESKFLSAKVKYGCSEGGSPLSLGRKAPAC